MVQKQAKKKDSLEEKMKLEIAEELGLLEKVKKEGWGSLTAKETGRIGGIITQRKQLNKAKSKQSEKPSN